jgi:hypothetical protein
MPRVSTECTYRDRRVPMCMCTTLLRDTIPVWQTSFIYVWSWSPVVQISGLLFFGIQRSIKFLPPPYPAPTTSRGMSVSSENFSWHACQLGHLLMAFLSALDSLSSPACQLWQLLMAFLSGLTASHGMLVSPDSCFSWHACKLLTAYHGTLVTSDSLSWHSCQLWQLLMARLSALTASRGMAVSSDSFSWQVYNTLISKENNMKSK